MAALDNTTCIHSANKAAIAKLRVAMSDFEEAAVRAALADIIAPDTTIQL